MIKKDKQGVSIAQICFMRGYHASRDGWDEEWFLFSSCLAENCETSYTDHTSDENDRLKGTA